MSVHDQKQWFAPAKAIRGGVRITSWRGAISVIVFATLEAADICLLSPSGSLLVGVLMAVVFAIFAWKKGAKPNYTIFN
jgi:hypothetical protein